MIIYAFLFLDAIVVIMKHNSFVFLLLILLINIGISPHNLIPTNTYIYSYSINSEIIKHGNSENAWCNLQGDYRHSGFFPVSSNNIPAGAVGILGYPASPIMPVSGDFDNDGLMEFAIVDSSGLVISLVNYRGIEKSFKVSKAFISMLSAKINNRWYLILVSPTVLYIVKFNLNEESKNFEVISIYSGEIFLSSVLSVDINNDGNSEIIFCNKTGLYMLENASKVSRIVSIDLSGVNDAWTLAADFDGDGKLEIFVITRGKTLGIKNSSIFLERNIGSICLPAAGDLDGDGKDEIVLCCNGIKVLDDGETISLNLSASGFSIANIDNDPEKEIIALSGSNLVAIYDLVNENIVALDSQVNTIPITVDFDGDGKAEIVYVADGKLKAIFGNGTAFFEYPRNFTVFYQYMSASDLNGDRLPEVIVFQEYWGEVKAFCYSFIGIEFPIKELLNNITQFLSNISVEYNVETYHTYDEITQILSQLVSEHSNAEIFVIGKSYWYNGTFRNITAVKITNGDNKPKPSIMLIGAYHARELITAEAALYLAYLFIKYHTHPVISKILNAFDVIIVPVVNVGGHDYAMYFDWQRKNLHPIDEDFDGKVDEDTPVDLNGDGLIDMWYAYVDGSFIWLGFEGYDKDGDGRFGEDPYGGVDLNRNHMYSWSHASSLGNPASEIYSGSAPLSEPETQAINSLMNKTRPIFAISLHSGEELVLFPWATGYKTPIDAEIIHSLALLTQIATEFPAIQSCGLYEAPGAWDDDAYGLFGILSFTIEIFRNESGLQFVYVGKMNGYDLYAYRGVKWLFNPMPGYIEEVCQKVAKAFLLVSYYAKARILSDTTPPLIENANVKIKNNNLLVNVYARDPESGIAYVELTYKINTDFYSKTLVYNKEKDCWSGEIPITNEIYVLIRNRANLTVKTLLPAFKIIEPLHEAFVNSSIINVRWLCGLNASRFELYLNGTLIKEVSGDVHQCSITVDSDGTYNLTIVAYADEEPLERDSIIFFVDTTPPTIEVINPQNNTQISQNMIIVNWTASDNFGIDHFEIRLNNEEWINVGNQTSYVFKNVPDGEYIIYLRAYDIAGNVNEIAIKVIVKTQKIDYIYPLLAILIAIIIVSAIILYKKRKKSR